MTAANELASAAELLDYARAIEEAAAQRYLELADVMDTHHNRELVAFFRRMAEIEQKHVDDVKRLQGAEAPADRSWPDLGGGEAPDFGEFHYLHLPYHAVSIALRFEQRAADFFDGLAGSAKNPEVRALAGRLAEEEAGHIFELNQVLARYPAPPADWDYDPDPPGEE